MRKRLPDTAKLFLARLAIHPEQIVDEIRLIAQGYTDAPADNVNGIARWLYEPRGRIWFFTQAAQSQGLHASEAREAYLAISPEKQRSLDSAIDAVLETERNNQKAAALGRVAQEHGE